jgi:small redox-active disulfide protein 2
MLVKVMGPGCQRCLDLYGVATSAVRLAGLDAEVIKVQNVEEFRAAGVMMTPALVVDGEIKCAGRIPEAAEVVSWLMTAAVRASA